MTAKIDGTNGLLQQYDYQVLTTAFSYTFAAGTTVLVINPAGTLAAGTITMPAAPADGMTISFSSTQAITALTVSGNTGQSIVGNPTTMNAGGAVTLVYRLSNTSWYAQVNTASLQATTGVPVLNVFTTSSTYTKPGTVKAIKVTVVGGGNSGGSSPASPPLGSGGGGGGGGGGTSVHIYPAPSLPGSAIPYTVGAAAATSSFGVAPITVITATAGSAGSNAPNGAGGASGTGSGGTLNLVGIPGGNGSGVPPGTSFGGYGGSSALGGGALAIVSGGIGNTATGIGGGGGGALSTNPLSRAAGSGFRGVVIIEEFY